MSKNDKNLYMKIFERLKELIGNESISSVAKQIGIPQQMLSRYLLCQREIGLENLCKIANFYGKRRSKLFNRYK